MYTTKDFITNVGRQPELDDLDRANCRQAGKIGHQDCGVCEAHNKPVFCCSICFHLAHTDKQFKRKKIDPMITCNANRNRVKWSAKLKSRMGTSYPNRFLNAHDARIQYPAQQINKMSRKELASRTYEQQEANVTHTYNTIN